MLLYSVFKIKMNSMRILVSLRDEENLEYIFLNLYVWKVTIINLNTY